MHVCQLSVLTINGLRPFVHGRVELGLSNAQFIPKKKNQIARGSPRSLVVVLRCGLCWFLCVVLEQNEKVSPEAFQSCCAMDDDGSEG